MASVDHQDGSSNATNSPNTQGYYVTQDEISLLELWDGLIKHWKTIAVSTILGTMVTISGALVHDYTQDPVFNITLYISPPKDRDIQPLFLTRIASEGTTATTPWTPKAPAVPKVTTAFVFGAFQRNLASATLQNKFSTKNKVPVTFNIGVDANNLYVHTESVNPDEATAWANGYIEFIAQYTITEIVANLRYLVDNRIKVIQHALDSLHVVANKQMETKISELKEAIEIAERLNIVERILQTPLHSTSVPLYYLGSNALRAELDIHLSKKKRGQPLHIENAFRLTQQLKELHDISIDLDGVRAVEVNPQAAVSQKPIQPSTTRILGIGFFISFLGGLFIAFFRYYIARQRAFMKNLPVH
tara:strand:+ start:3741 stop:4820 length:1080 start_codon:yes stop_codon:yes gene_type:complete